MSRSFGCTRSGAWRGETAAEAEATTRSIAPADRVKFFMICPSGCATVRTKSQQGLCSRSVMENFLGQMRGRRISGSNAGVG